MTRSPHLLPLFAALLVAAPVLAASTHTGTWTASVKEKEAQLELSLRTKGERGGQMGMSVPLTAFQGLSTAEGSTAPFRMTREAGTFSFEGRFAGGEGAGHYQFEPSEAYAKAMSGLGYPKLTPDDQFKLALFEVTTTRVKELATLGYRDLPLEELFQVGIFQVTAEYIRTLSSLGYGKLSLEQLVQCRIHNVTPEFIRDMKGLGLQSLSAEDLVKLRIHGIDSDFVRSLSGGKREGDARRKP
ncbi:hypothetical protein [Hyalangium sp.]|uniref:hypothetical protein n=1 Tax=Hyalangium sp. TaxID=2028555 RepID=UPI002D544554|nr:hypothetical protein [Hyalangium sp.]HYH94838.1 hypothetical protein [Hyalangium sp.]